MLEETIAVFEISALEFFQMQSFTQIILNLSFGQNGQILHRNLKCFITFQHVNFVCSNILCSNGR